MLTYSWLELRHTEYCAYWISCIS